MEKYCEGGFKESNGLFVEQECGQEMTIPLGRKNMDDCKVNILGTEYTIRHRDEKEDSLLDGKFRDGYTDFSTHEIVICNKRDDCELQDYESYKKVILRHELMHAFLMESGLDASSISTCGAWATNEEMVDWFAIQSPKIFKVYAELGLIDVMEMLSIGGMAADFIATGQMMINPDGREHHAENPKN